MRYRLVTRVLLDTVEYSYAMNLGTRSRGTYTRVSSTSSCAREFVCVVTGGLERSSPSTRTPLEDETTLT